MGLSWNQLFANGSIVDLNTSIWTAKTKIKPEDLGIEDTREVQEALALGQHRLAPKYCFEAIREASRGAARAIDNYSLNFAMIKGARYVPDANIETLMNQLIALKLDFTSAVEEFLNKYDEMKAVQLPIIREALKKAAKTELIGAVAYQRIEEEYPSADQVRNKFSLKWSVYAVQGAKSQAALAAITQETHEVRSVVSSMVGQLRKELTDKVTSVLTITNKVGKLTNRSIESAMSVLDKVESLNILEDEVLANQVTRLRETLTSVDPEEESVGLSAELEGIKNELESSAEQAVIDAEAALTGLGRRKLG